jgi:hypothetical protein
MPDRWAQTIVESFSFDFESTSVMRESHNLSLYRVSGQSDLYIIDSVEGRRLATDPSIVGEEFDSLNRSLSAKVWDLMKGMGVLNTNIIFEHVLRAAPGYRLRDVMKNDSGFEIKDFYIRPRYIRTSYRDHSENDLETVYMSDLKVDSGKRYTLVKPDTEATGRSSILSIDRILSLCKEKGANIDRVVLYGFISEVGYRRILEFCNQQKISLTAIAVEDLTALASNGYDMPVYGIDDELKMRTGDHVKLVSVIPERVFKLMLPTYFPGMDQPGDWSERQLVLYNGTTFERGDVLHHLSKSLARLQELRSIYAGESWYLPEIDDLYWSKRDSLIDKIAEVNAGIDAGRITQPDFNISK